MLKKLNTSIENKYITDIINKINDIDINNITDINLQDLINRTNTIIKQADDEKTEFGQYFKKKELLTKLKEIINNDKIFKKYFFIDNQEFKSATIKDIEQFKIK
jgi:hypothetical protein